MRIRACLFFSSRHSGHHFRHQTLGSQKISIILRSKAAEFNPLSLQSFSSLIPRNRRNSAHFAFSEHLSTYAYLEIQRSEFHFFIHGKATKLFQFVGVMQFVCHMELSFLIMISRKVCKSETPHALRFQGVKLSALTASRVEQ